MNMYNLELEKIKELILENKAKSVLLQLPDGLKPKSKEIVDGIKKYSKANIYIWAGSCFGACDYPTNIEGIDIMISWGHSEWR